MTRADSAFVSLLVFVLCASTAHAQTASRPSDAELIPQRDASADDTGFVWDDGPALKLGRSATIRFRGRLQLDVRGSEADTGDADGFDVSRRRIGVDGEVGRWLEFQVERELDASTPWRDVYVNYRPFDAVQVQAGKFKLPFGLDENTSSVNLDFVYRSRAATQLAPGRDRGVMLHGRALDRVIGYELGVFNRDGDNARTGDDTLVSGDRTFAGRVTAQPFRGRKSQWRDLQVGGAFTASDVPEGIPALGARTALDASFFPEEIWVRGARRRLGLELRWRPGPYSVKAEYIRVATERLGQSVEATDLSDLVATGWYVSGTYLITGERKVSGAESPKRPLFRGGYGAFEIAARIERLRFGSAATGAEPSSSPRAEVVLPNADLATTVGVNWYPLRGVKVQANVIAEAIMDPSRGPRPDRSRFWSQLLRLQLSI